MRPADIDGARETSRWTIRDGNRAADVITRLRALFSKKEFTLESQRKATVWVSGSLSAAPSSRDIMVVSGRSRMTGQAPPSRFPFPAVRNMSLTRYPR